VLQVDGDLASKLAERDAPDTHSLQEMIGRFTQDTQPQDMSQEEKEKRSKLITFAEKVQQQDCRGSRERAGSFAPATPSIVRVQSSPSVDRATFENIGLSHADTEFIFSKLDVDEDGKITKAEVKYNLTELAKVSEDQAEVMMTLINSADDDAEISFVQFSRALEHLCKDSSHCYDLKEFEH